MNCSRTSYACNSAANIVTVNKKGIQKLWINRINAVAKLNGTKYSTLIQAALAGIEVNRKVLADIAVHAPRLCMLSLNKAIQKIKSRLNRVKKLKSSLK